MRRQLDPIWHRVSAKTKQLVGDLTTLRNLLKYVRETIAFRKHCFLTLFASALASPFDSYLLTYDSVTFNSYLETILASSTTTAKGTTRQNQSAWLFMDAANVIFHEAKRRVYVWDESRPLQPVTEEQNYADDEEALRQAEGSRETLRTARAGPIPPEVEPVLEENPKWHLLQEVLDEVEQEIHFNVAASGKCTCMRTFRGNVLTSCSPSPSQTRKLATRF